jgi:very-short-patch-repair endonuclease
MKAAPVVLRERARRLRAEHTDAEALLWSRLRARQLAAAKFRRQQPIGRFIVDFCCMEHRLVIELDGGQHAERVERDRQRSDALQAQGFRVLRFWNHELLTHIDAVMESIYRELVRAADP